MSQEVAVVQDGQGVHEQQDALEQVSETREGEQEHAAVFAIADMRTRAFESADPGLQQSTASPVCRRVARREG